MNLRRTLEQNQTAVGIGAVVVLVLAAAFMFMGGESEPPPVAAEWYFDTGAKKLYTGEPGLVAPLDAPSGAGKGVKAYVYSCGACTAAERFVGYTETYTPEGKAALDDRNKTAEVAAGHRICDGQGEGCVPASSPEAKALMAAANAKCGGKSANVCRP